MKRPLVSRGLSRSDAQDLGDGAGRGVHADDAGDDLEPRVLHPERQRRRAQVLLEDLALLAGIRTFLGIQEVLAAVPAERAAVGVAGQQELSVAAPADIGPDL